ncbi:MAG: hypothetical protein LH632_17075 [Rhodoferax sp.]|nr:hypothetical protein [Rhodoferax sp.]
MDLIKRLFGTTKQAEVPAPPQLGAPSDSRMPEQESVAGTRRELVRVMARDVQRAAGIPDGWLEMQVMPELSRGQTFIHLRLVVRHWDERLVNLQVAFQRRVLAEVERFEPDARQWIGSITWLYPDDSDCPHTDLPDPAIWKKVDHVDIEIDDVQEDLARLFAVRDAEMSTPLSSRPQP